MTKSLKEQNNGTLWLIVAVNALVFYGVVKADAISVDGISAAFQHAQALVPVGIASVIMTVLNALPSADMKATIVFWRFRHALPGHRAFTVYANKDTRISQQKLRSLFKGSLPTDPAEQNAAWYKLYRTVRDDVIVISAHKLFLLLRDYTALSVLFIVVFGIWSAISVPDKHVAIGYTLMLLTQYLIVRKAASNAGIRMVTNVLCLKTSMGRN